MAFNGQISILAPKVANQLRQLTHLDLFWIVQVQTAHQHHANAIVVLPPQVSPDSPHGSALLHGSILKDHEVIANPGPSLPPMLVMEVSSIRAIGVAMVDNNLSSGPPLRQTVKLEACVPYVDRIHLPVV